MASARGLLAVGLFVSMATTGCTSKAAGDIAFGIVGAVAAAMVQGAVNAAANGSGSSEPSRPVLSECEQLREEWRQSHGDARLPLRLHCTSEGYFPEDTVEPAEEDPRTDVGGGVCGGSTTAQTKCEPAHTPTDFL